MPEPAHPPPTSSGPGDADASPDAAHEVEFPSLTLPILPAREVVLFPYTLTSLVVSEPTDIQLVGDSLEQNRMVALIPVRSVDAPRRKSDFFPYGCIGRIVKMLRFPDDSLRILLRGVRRARLMRLRRGGEYFVGRLKPVEAAPDESPETVALARTVFNQFYEVITLSPNLPDELQLSVYNIDDPGRLADLIAEQISLKFEEKLQVLQAVALRPRLELVAAFLNREAVILKASSEIQSRVSEFFSKNQREQFLREQLKAVQEQLGQEPETPEVAELRQRVEGAHLPEAAHEAAMHEIGRLRLMHPSSPEYNVARTYVDWIVSLPWQQTPPLCVDLGRARTVLDRDHFDLEKVKERILDYLAVLHLKEDMKAPILCFVGPPGVGKTSLGRSIAGALGRKFVRLSLGGVRDEAEIRGHRRTYIGALPGRVIQGLRKVGVANPVFMLDEVDKIGKDFRGDPASALLEVLDPEQNYSFSDHYLEIPFDLSRVFFITTANLEDPIPPALHDRMEIIRLPGYTHLEKRQIARRWLFPRQLDAHGLDRSQLLVRARAIDNLIRRYTAEAGVRDLERTIGTICRKHARHIVEGEADGCTRTVVDTADLMSYLGPPKVFPDVADRRRQVGVSTGLAWTASGGEILHIEATFVPGKGALMLTGSLGDVMKESAHIAWSYVRNRYRELGFDPAPWADRDIHIHVPAGATPKDGPSAGVALAAALASLVTGRAVLPYRAVTGEVSLRGRVLPVGGIKEKVLAALRAGVRMVLLPKKNRNDLDEIPEEVRKKLRFELISDAAEALELLLEPPGVQSA
ncbi:MAG: endopeptidase La [Kiritimatiellaeota bacterium]|nr:endopeptidase La [Kiritimatiellota bacterium]